MAASYSSLRALSSLLSNVRHFLTLLSKPLHSPKSPGRDSRRCTIGSFVESELAAAPLTPRLAVLVIKLEQGALCLIQHCFALLPSVRRLRLTQTCLWGYSGGGSCCRSCFFCALTAACVDNNESRDCAGMR